MLVLTRKTQESVIVCDGIGGQVRVTVLEVKGGKVRLSFDADPDIGVHRAEVWERICAQTPQSKQYATNATGRGEDRIGVQNEVIGVKAVSLLRIGRASAAGDRTVAPSGAQNFRTSVA